MRHVGGQSEGQFSVEQVLNTVKQVHNSVKQVLNTVKHGQNSVKSQSNGRVKPLLQYKPAWDPKTRLCSGPLGSPTRC